MRKRKTETVVIGGDRYHLHYSKTSRPTSMLATMALLVGLIFGAMLAPPFAFVGIIIFWISRSRSKSKIWHLQNEAREQALAKAVQRREREKAAALRGLKSDSRP